MLSFLGPISGPTGITSCLGDRLVEFYSNLEDPRRAKRTQRLANIILKDARAENRDTPLVKAIRIAAERIDDGTWSKLADNFFHGAPHFREIACNNYVLSVLSRKLYIPPLATDPLEGFLAGLVHDVLHDGGINGKDYYRLERTSFETVKPMLAECGMDEAAIFRIEMMLLATAVADGERAVLKHIHDHHEKGVPLDLSGVPEHFDKRLLKALQEDRNLCRQCALICDADLMPSIGLGYKWAMKNGRAFARERGWPSAQENLHKGHLGFAEGVFIAPTTPAMVRYCMSTHRRTMDRARGINRPAWRRASTRPLPRSRAGLINGRHAAALH